MKITIIPVGILETNCYLLASEEGNCAVIDPGAQPEKILETIDKKKLVPQYILLTHGHHDHIGGVKRVLEAFPGAVLAIGVNDLEMLGDNRKSLGMANDRLDQSDRGNAKTLVENDELTLDELRIKVLDTPGHTRGGVTYLCGDVLFTGDTLFAGDVGRCDLPGGNYAVLKKSLAKLTALKGDYRVFPGHGPSSTLDTERERNPYINGEIE